MVFFFAHGIADSVYSSFLRFLRITTAAEPTATAATPSVAPKPAAPALKPAADLPVAEVPLYEEEKPVSSVSQDTEGLFPDDVRSEAEKSVKTVIELPEIIPPEDLL